MRNEFFLLVLALMGCESVPMDHVDAVQHTRQFDPTCWWIDGYELEHFEASQTAMAEWNAALDAQRLRECESFGIIRFVPGAPAGASVGGEALTLDTVAVYPDVVHAYGRDLAASVAHELGHAIATWAHLESGLMQAGGLEELCVDELAIEQACLWFACGPAAGSTCEEESEP